MPVFLTHEFKGSLFNKQTLMKNAFPYMYIHNCFRRGVTQYK